VFILEYKQLYIVPEPLTKNRTCQSYRWKQFAMCESREALQKIIDKAAESRNFHERENWRIEEYPPKDDQECRKWQRRRQQ
jgi:hypothetical protein